MICRRKPKQNQLWIGLQSTRRQWRYFAKQLTSTERRSRTLFWKFYMLVSILIELKTNKNNKHILSILSISLSHNRNLFVEKQIYMRLISQMSADKVKKLHRVIAICHGKIFNRAIMQCNNRSQDQFQCLIKACDIVTH
jgi:hypothetical protein